jgi:exonuclease III
MPLVRILLAFALSFHLVAQADRRPDPTRIRVMSFNTKFMWDGRAPEEGDVSFPWKFSPDEADDHMRAIAGAIQRHDPDIVLLVEVEGTAALNRLNTQFLAGQAYEVVFHQGDDFNTGQDVAILTRITPKASGRDDSRVPIEGSSQKKGVSKNIFANFEVGTLKFAVIGLHLLAQPSNTSRRPEREAQAKVIRARALALRQEGFQVLVCGDFNDYDGELGCLDRQDSTPISKVLSTIRGMDPADTADDLANCCARVPKNERYTSWWDRDDDETVDTGSELTSIDHILLDHALDLLVQGVVFGNANYDFPNTSDHCPIVVTLGVGGALPPGRLRIHSALPNPAGDESQEEVVALVTEGGGTTSLQGWKLRDAAKTEWDLGSEPAVASATDIKRKGRKMGLNNGGDTIMLVDPQGTIVHTVTYGKATEGERVFFN